jgi:predicted ATPase
MIKSVCFRNFKALRDTVLPLGRFTLIVGPNGSGKSTAMQALRAMSDPARVDFRRIATAGLPLNGKTVAEVIVEWGSPFDGVTAEAHWSLGGYSGPTFDATPFQVSGDDYQLLRNSLSAIRVYSFDAPAIAALTPLHTEIALESNGRNLAGVLDQLRDREPERFDAFNEEMSRWLPEFERVLFETPTEGQRAILLRTQQGHHKIQASELSQGTLIALAMLTLAYIPNPPPIVCLEEPDRGIHPRLLREVRDAMYRLSYPENYGEKRDPVQVIATTHSPYLLDLFRDHPEEVVIANKVDQDVRFERLSDRDDLDEILGDAQLGDVWYSGILGGVPSHP